MILLEAQQNIFRNIHLYLGYININMNNLNNRILFSIDFVFFLIYYRLHLYDSLLLYYYIFNLYM